MKLKLKRQKAKATPTRAWYMVRDATGKELFFHTLPEAYTAWAKERGSKKSV